MTSAVRSFRNWITHRHRLNPYLSGSFKPEEYLRTYYPALPEPSVFGNPEILTSVSEENLALLRFYADTQAELQQTGKGSWMLEVGGGPTIYQLISLSELVSRICFTDFLRPNLQSVERWIRTGSDARWLSYIRMALQYEHGKTATNKEVAFRESELKRKISLARFDVLRDHFSEPTPQKFSIVSSSFCIECISQDKTIWLQALRNISRRIAEGGCLVMTALRMASTYNIQGRTLPSTPINEEDVLAALLDLGFFNINISSRDCLGENEYNGMIYVLARKDS
ncbi:MAG: guanitoxin biosynthesis pre-guanitoxin forming N-methyltransferase GntF [Candidatus Doudnabacteria bacterium]